MVRKTITLMCLAAAIISGMVCVTAEEKQDEKTVPIVWFDGAGAYHYSDPLPYLNSVFQGKVNDPQLKDVMMKVCKESGLVSREHLPLIAAALNPLRDVPALYYPDQELIERNHQTVREAFQSESKPTGNLIVKTFAFRTLGDVSQVIVGTGSNRLIAIPADSKVMTLATNEMDGETLVLEKTLMEYAENGTLKALSRITTPDTEGNNILFNLRPGPWIVYVDQGGLITQCYRVIVRSGHQNELIADKMCCPPRSQITFRKELTE